jgi:hypothetical protein
MTDEELLARAQNKCEELQLALLEIGACAQAARTPIDEGELDFVTVRCELTDMDCYLTQARFAAGSMRDAMVDLVSLVRRLQAAYHALYQAWQIAQTDLDQWQAIRPALVELDQESLAILSQVSEALAHAEGMERSALHEGLAEVLSRDRE